MAKISRRDYINQGLRQCSVGSRIVHTPKNRELNWDINIAEGESLDKISGIIRLLNTEYKIVILGWRPEDDHPEDKEQS